jgi:phage terminase large subunit
MQLPQVTVNTIAALNMNVSPVFMANQTSLTDLVINQGGTRSGKTYSILQCILVYCMTNKGKLIDVVRKTQAELWATALLDWIEILTAAGIYDERFHHKTKNEFFVNGNTVRFIGMDKAAKKRGQKRHLLYINEANGLTLEDWVQLSVRTMEKIYIDFNPSEFFWLNEHIIDKKVLGRDYDFIKSTYLDNYDFLTEKNIKEIENLIEIDDYYYRVYVLGELATMKGKIYDGYRIIPSADYHAITSFDYDRRIYGLDFGYDHYMSLMEIKIIGERVLERELFCFQKKTDDDLIKFMIENDVSMVDDIYADPAAPSSIWKIKDAGFEARKAKKDVYEGIRFCQQIKRSISDDSVNYLRQMSRYKWRQTSNGEILKEPVKIDDDCPDAMRYAEFTELRKAA